VSSFTTPLIVQPISARQWKLIEPFEYHVGSEDSQEVIRVPVDFITDFASVPRLFWSILPPWGKYGKAAVIHDYCYRNGLYPRKRCDEIFLEGMTVLRVAAWKRYPMYYAVMVFGSSSYRRLATRQNT
jgi:hypothetical protein